MKTMVKLHVKPTKAELQANALAAAAEYEKEKAEETKPPVETPKEEPTPPPVEEVKEEVIEEPAPPETTPAPEEPKEEVEESTVVDYKKKYVDSTRGAQALLEKDKAMNEAIDIAASLPPPTDEEMTVIYPDWDVMSDSEKRVATRSEMADRKFELLHKASSVNKEVAKWQEGIDKFIENPVTLNNYPSLEGKQDEFKIYAANPTFRGSDYKLIVKSFLFDSKATAKPKSVGGMFPKGSPGPSNLDNPTNKITYAEMDNIRVSNFKLYKEKLKLIKQGKIEVEAIE